MGLTTFAKKGNEANHEIVLMAQKRRRGPSNICGDVAEVYLRVSQPYSPINYSTFAREVISGGARSGVPMLNKYGSKKVESLKVNLDGVVVIEHDPQILSPAI